MVALITILIIVVFGLFLDILFSQKVKMLNKRLSQKIEKMSYEEINLRAKTLFDELEKGYSFEKQFEYDMLSKELNRRK